MELLYKKYYEIEFFGKEIINVIKHNPESPKLKIIDYCIKRLWFEYSGDLGQCSFSLASIEKYTDLSYKQLKDHLEFFENAGVLTQRSNEDYSVWIIHPFKLLNLIGIYKEWDNNVWDDNIKALLFNVFIEQKEKDDKINEEVEIKIKDFVNNQIIT